MADFDNAEPVPRHGGRSGGARDGKRRGGGGGRGNSDGGNRDVILSKALSTLLRHQAEAAGVELDGEGYARLDQVFQWPRIRSLKPTVSEIKAAVADNAKQRFALKRSPEAEGQEGLDADEDDPKTWMIRANQGHSIKLASEGLHTRITLGGEAGQGTAADTAAAEGNIPPVVVHGTYFIFWPAILAAGGLKKMGRTHVHFGTGLPEDGRKQTHEIADEDSTDAGSGNGGGNKRVISGMRSDAELLIFVDVEQSLRDGGIEWWLSSNGVVLTEGDRDGVVPLKYFKEVRGRKQGVGQLWKDGVKVADLPEGTVARMPHGKGPGGSRGGRGGRRGGKQ
ncbi:KptA family-domain-containing protein [Microdochium trichocladiopsis]|uniref:2'-phosphotransferase n=1 Tax=Microdochium trichocladiopsis TaxID=1682393 RepID=A0A9P8YBV2_9PEZI|nr:KptA family-domain-containing protein [Microdochium trichocladiopsis]KAH7037861.1 KptA family-domain-containing protein [Microdochium trichocladiopsis]